MIIFADNESVMILDKDRGITDTMIPVRNIWYKDRLLDNKQIWVSGDGNNLLVASSRSRPEDEGRDVRAPLPWINVTVVFLDNLSNISLNLMEFRENFADDFYLSGVSWTPVDDVTITLTSRNQSLVTILICSAPNFSCTEVDFIW